MEVILETLGEDHNKDVCSTEPESDTCHTEDSSLRGKTRIAMDLAQKAKAIYDMEKEGKEIVFVPWSCKVTTYLEAIAKGLLG